MPDYSVPDDPASQAKIEGRLDTAYAAWVQAGRPALGSPSALWRDRNHLPSAGALPPSGMTITPIDALPRSHVSPGLEARLVDVLASEVETQSCTARAWGSAVLNRLVRELGVAEAATVVTAMGPGRDGVHVEIIHTPGVAADLLRQRLRPYFEAGASSKWRDWLVGETPTRAWTQTIPGLSTYLVVWFAHDDYSIRIVTPNDPAEMQQLILNLSQAL
jgi:hypothetical protein